MADMDRVEIEGLTVDCVVGVLEEEQRTLQPVVIDLVLSVELDGAAAGDLGESVDYASVVEAVTFLAQHGRFRLLESLAACIARWVLAPPPPSVHQRQVERVRVRLRKPRILADAVPGVTIERGAEWCDLQTRMVPDKTWLDTLVETRTEGAYRALLQPGTAWPVPAGAAVLVVAGVVEGEGRRFERGARLARGEVTRLLAAGGGPASLLVVSSPPLGGGVS